ncbi:MAG: response regulator [Bacteroidota bacterium]
MGKSKILIIDDDNDLVASFRVFLESNNYEISTAANTKIGLDVIRNFHPDLIILDIIMDTNLEGFNFLNDLKTDDNFRMIPVIMNTSMAKVLGVNMRSAIDDIGNLPNTRFIEKSGDWDELLNAVKGLLTESKR